MYMAIVTSLCRLLTKNHQLTLATLSLAKATVLLVPGHPTHGCVEHYMLYPFIYNNTCYNIHGAMMIKFWQDGLKINEMSKLKDMYFGLLLHRDVLIRDLLISR